MGLKAITTRFANGVFTGVSKFADGSLAAPSIAFTSAANTGFYRTSGDRIVAGAAGAELWAGVGGYFLLPVSQVFAWTTGAAGTTGADTGFTRVGTNAINYAGALPAAGAVTSRTEINKAVTAFTDAVAKTVLTITIPNAAHSASILVRVTGSLGAGGAIGANEATASNGYIVSVTRTAGVNATAAISAAFGAAATAVAGAATVTAVATLDTVSGAVGATNTIAIQVTITRSGGSSDNHTAVVTASLLNANATGVTIA